ncbi:MAG: ABC transporter transmembrane domain-containing protein, partial [Desulfovibrionaceae bacterium]
MPRFRSVPRPEAVRRPLLARLWLRPRRQYAMLLAAAATAGLRMVPVELQRRIVDRAIVPGDAPLLVRLCLIFLAAVLAAEAIRLWLDRMQAALGEDAVAELRRDFFARLLRLPLSFARANRTGSIVAPISVELAEVGEWIGQALSVPVMNGLGLIGIGVYLAHLNPLLAALSMLLYPATLLLIPPLQRRANRYDRERVLTGQALGGKISETVSGLREVKAHAAAPVEARLFARTVEAQRAARLSWQYWRLSARTLNNLVLGVSPFLVFLVGGLCTMRGIIDLGELVAFLGSQALIYGPWRDLMDFYQKQQDAVVRYRRVQEFFNIPAEPDIPADPDAPADPGASDVPDAPARPGPLGLALEGVTVLGEGGAPILQDVTLAVPPGARLVLVGPSGGGKSTLAACLAGVIRPTRGRARLDGRDTAALSRRDLARSVGFLGQTPYIFDGAVRDTLLYPRNAVLGRDGAPPPPPPRDDMVLALQRAGAYLDVLLLGLDVTLDQTAHPEL